MAHNNNAQDHEPPGGPFKDELDDFERFTLERLVRGEWGLKAATLNRLMYCGVSVECLQVIEERDLNDIFNDDRAIGQKILLRHRLRDWRRGLHWNSPEPPVITKRKYERRDPLEIDKKPRISISNGTAHSIGTPPMIMLPDSRNPSVMESSSNSSPSAAVVSSLASSNFSLQDAGNLPIRITPEAMAHFLQSSRSGRWVVNYFAENRRLDKKALTELTHIIVEPFLIYNITFTHALMRHYAEVIVSMFPSEQMETFYCPRNTIRKNPTGKLYDRYVNQRLRFKTKFNAQRPTVVEESQLHRTFAEMSIVGDAVMNQQYLDYTGEPQQSEAHIPRVEINCDSGSEFVDTSPKLEMFSEESLNVYGADDNSIL